MGLDLPGGGVSADGGSETTALLEPIAMQRGAGNLRSWCPPAVPEREQKAAMAGCDAFAMPSRNGRNVRKGDGRSYVKPASRIATVNGASGTRSPDVDLCDLGEQVSAPDRA